MTDIASPSKASAPYARTGKNTYFLVGDITAVTQLATCGAELAASAGKLQPTPIPTYRNDKGVVMYMPGSGFRSKLRGAACALVLEAIESRGGKRFDLKDAQLNRVGGIKQGGAESKLNMQAFAQMIDANPILGLFGAATPWVKGKAMISHISCLEGGLAPMRVEGVRSDIFRREPDLINYLADGSLESYTQDIARTQRYSEIKGEKARLDVIVKRGTPDERKAAKADIARIDAEVKEKDLRHVSAQMPLKGYLAIPPGTKLENKIALVRVSQIELGCFMAAMERFAEEPVLGAHGAHGAGVISGTWGIHKTGVGPIGAIHVEPFIGLHIECQELADAKAAFEAFVMTEACSPYADEASLALTSGETEEADHE